MNLQRLAAAMTHFGGFGSEQRRRRLSGRRRIDRRVAAFEQLEHRHLLAGTVSLVDPTVYRPTKLTELNGQLFFNAIDSLDGVTSPHGFELWKSDGTQVGTALVKDIFAGVYDSNPDYLANVGGTLFFSALDPSIGYELWKSDGTTAGTVLVKDIRPGTTGSYIEQLTDVNGTAFFSAGGLWKSDGTAAGTVLVKDINDTGDYRQGLEWLTNIGGVLFFTVGTLANGRELWKSDGTTGGTVLVKDINPGSGSSTYLSPFDVNRTFVDVNGTLYFGADDGVHGFELWKSDGTTAGTVMVTDIVSGSGGSVSDVLINVNGVLYFVADDGTNGPALWKSDGTPGGTVLVKDILNGNGNPDIGSFTNVAGTLFFRADDGINGLELWKSDGTANGTALVKDIFPGPDDSLPFTLANFQGKLFFEVNDGVHGYELWVSDGAEAGTMMVQDIRPGNANSSPSYFIALGDNLFFSAIDDTLDRRLYVYTPPLGNPPTDLALSNNTLPENEPAGTTVGAFSSTDPDLGDTFSYTLVPGAGSADNARFAIDASGQLNTAEVLDFEAQTSYAIRVRTRDQTGQFFEKPFVITVTNVDDPPRFTSSALTAATEDAAYGYSITTQDDEGDSRTISATTLPAWLAFVDNGNGTATLSGLPTNGEVGPHSVVLEVSGSGGATQQAFTITVANTNDPPAGLLLSSAVVPENLQPGSFVGRFTTADVDVGDAFTYSLVSGAGSSGNNSFKIVGDTLRTNSVFDLDVQNSFSVRVRTTDQGGLFFEKAFTITIIDANDAPTFTSAAKTAATEDSVYNYAITTHDDDGNPVILSAATLPAWLTFTDHGDGTATLSGTPTNAEVGQHDVVLEASDGIAAAVRQSFTITVANVNDAPTGLNLSASAVAENRFIGLVVGSFSTVDVDAGSTFTYSLVSGTGSADNAAFTVVGSSLKTAATFNFEVQNSYSIRVRTTDNGGLRFEKAFTISISNVNESPRFAATAVPAATEDVAYSYGVAALDEDGDPLTITAITLPAWLTLTDNGDGTATLTGTPTNANVGQQNVLLEATDGVTTAGQLLFTVTVVNTNDAPVLNTALTPTLTTIVEDAKTPGNTLVSNLLANAVTDVDAGALRGIAVTTASNFNGRWEYLLSGGVWTGMKSPSSLAALLLPSSARVRFLPKADFNGQVTFLYRAWDQTAGSAGGTLPVAGNNGDQHTLSTATETVTLTVTPDNDAPVLNNALAPSLGSIPEEAPAPAGTLVSSLIAGAVTDVDAGALRGIAVFSAPATNGHWQFTLDGANWQEMGSPAETACLLLPANSLTKVRFLPAKDFFGTVLLKYRAWDRTTGSPPGPLTSTGNIGGNKTMSTATESATLTVTPVNDAPKLVLGGSTLNYVHNAPAVLLASSALVTDIDSPDFLGGQLRVRYIGGANSANRLTLGTNFTIDASNNVRLGTVLIGKRISNGFGTNELVITLYSGASKANVQQLVRAIKFHTVSGSAGVRRIAFSVSDGDGGLSAEVSRLVNVT